MESKFYEGIKKCCFTGYRPAKFPFSLNREDPDYKKFENALVEEMMSLVGSGCRVFYCGMAMGFDIIAAELVLMLKRAYGYSDIKLICVLPFPEQADSFTSFWRKRFNDILDLCDEKIILAKEYSMGCYQKRNVYMVDNSDAVLTWYDGKQGGTHNTIEYAAKTQKYIINTCNKSSGSFAVQTIFEII